MKEAVFAPMSGSILDEHTQGRGKLVHYDVIRRGARKRAFRD